MLRTIFLILLLAAGLAPAASAAPKLPSLANPGAAAAAAPSAQDAAAAHKADIAALIAALEDPTTRAALLDRLKALNAGPSSPSTPSQPPAPLSGAVQQLSGAVTSRVADTTAGVIDLGSTVSALPLLGSWLRAQIENPASRALWAQVAVQTGLAVALGIAAALAVRLLLRSWREAQGRFGLSGGWVGRLRPAAAHLAVDLAALATFLGVAYAALALLHDTALTKQIALHILTGIGIARSVSAVAKAVLAGHDPARRLLLVSDHDARALQRRFVLITGLLAYGYFLLQAALDLGLPWMDYQLLERIFLALAAITLIIMIVGFRPQLARWIEHWGQSSRSTVAGYVPWRGIAASGHFVLAAYVLVLYLVWALGMPGGTVLLTRGILVTAAVLFGQRLLILWAERRLRPKKPPSATDPAAADEVEEEPPARVSRTATLVTIRAVVIILGAAFVLQAWGLDIVTLLRTNSGSTLALIGLRLALILGLAVALAQLTNRVARRYLEARDASGGLVHSNRARTLASILRNIVLVTLAFTAAINALSQVGVNAAALFAGAGVVGLAVGFGSQRLVQDLITGLFILMGDSVRVGDVVELGGKSGAVEIMSMRAVTLRGYDGLVYTIPYSSIDVVTNMTKDFSYCVLQVGVGYAEDVDEVVEVLREIDRGMRREWPYRRQILEPIDIAGLDRFDESAIVVKARIKTRPGNQWSIGYEFHKRMKLRFEEKGIEIPYPHRKLVFAPGAAPIQPAMAEPAVQSGDPALRSEAEAAAFGRARGATLVRGG